MISAPMGKGLATLLVYLSIAFVAASILLVFAPEKGERLRELPLAIIALLAGTLVHTGTRVVRRPRFISGTLVVFGLLLMALLTAWRVMPVFVWGLGIEKPNLIGIASRGRSYSPDGPSPPARRASLTRAPWLLTI